MQKVKNDANLDSLTNSVIFKRLSVILEYIGDNKEKQLKIEKQV